MIKEQTKALYYDFAQYNNHWLPIVVSDHGLVYVGAFDDPIEAIIRHFDKKGSFDWFEDTNQVAPYRLQLEEYFTKRRRQFDLPLDWQYGTPFQQEVWTALLAIPYGDSSSYGEIARRIGRPQAVRAVGSAIGKNPLSIIVPCHRVLTSTGNLGGYSGGLDMKRALLELENFSWVR